MEKFTMKRPVKADYIRKYGFEGERIWRFELLKYEEAKQAFEKRQANIKAYQDKIKNEERAIRELVKKVQSEKPKATKATPKATTKKTTPKKTTAKAPAKGKAKNKK